MSNQVGVLRKVLTVLERHDISVDYVPNGIDNVSVVVPTEAILTSGSTQYVYVVQDNNTAKYIEVTTNLTVANGLGKIHFGATGGSTSGSGLIS